MSFFLNECYARMIQGEVIVAYKGSISAEVISNTLSLVETKLEESAELISVKKKLYNVLVESLQNLFHHVDALTGVNETDSNYGAFVLAKQDQVFRISTGNFNTFSAKTLIMQVFSIKLSELA